MIIEKEELEIFTDLLVNKPLYAHQKYVLNHDDWEQLKIHTPTSSGKTLSAVLFALKAKFDNPSNLVKTILTFPTNLLSQKQFEASVVNGLIQWVGAKERTRGILHPVKKTIEPGWSNFFNSYSDGAPTIVFDLPAKLDHTKLWITILNGEILHHMFTEENRLELGQKKGKYLFNILDTLSQRDHILITSPDLLGYVAQQCYSVSSGWYYKRWKDELSLSLSEHRIVVDEYHFYDPYTEINLEKTLDKLNTEKTLILSATERSGYFNGANVCSVAELEQDFAKDNVGKHTASYPIDIQLIDDELNIDTIERNPQTRTINFFNSVITAHEICEQLKNEGVRYTEWTGIQKKSDETDKLIIATSAAEVGLDLEISEMHTQFWGFDWEIPSLIQRIGRIGRHKSEYPSKAFVHISDTQQKQLIKSIFLENSTLTKDQLSVLLYDRYGGKSFNPKDYVSHYLWNENEMNQLKTKWMLIDSRISFYFRPPQSQAVFDWNHHKFIYNKRTIENQYHIEMIKEVTQEPFWSTFGLSEYKILQKKRKDERTWEKPYEGKLFPLQTSKKKFVHLAEQSNII